MNVTYLMWRCHIGKNYLRGMMMSASGDDAS